MNGWLIKRICLIMLCYFVVLMTMVLAFITQHLSPRGFGFAGGLSAIAFFCAFLVLFRKSKERNRRNPEPAVDEQTRKRLRLSIRYMQIYWIMLVIGLVVGLLEFERAALWPILAGITINLLLQYALFVGIRKTKQRLEQSSAGGSLEQSHR